MALVDDLKDYIARNSTPTTVIKEKHNVAIVGTSAMGAHSCSAPITPRVRPISSIRRCARYYTKMA